MYDKSYIEGKKEGRGKINKKPGLYKNSRRYYLKPDLPFNPVKTPRIFPLSLS